MNTNLRHGLFLCAVMVAFSLGPRASADLVDMEIIVTELVGSFQYDVTIRNNGLIDLTLVSIVDAPVADPLIDPSLTTPVGFLGLYDSGLGIIDLLEGASTFGAGLTVSGFHFNSTFLPGPNLFSTFDALDINGDNFRGTITLTSVPGAVPDAGSTITLASLALAVMAFGRRSRRLRHRPDVNFSPTPFHP